MKYKEFIFILIILSGLNCSVFATSSINQVIHFEDSTEVENVEKKVHFEFRPSLGLTYNNSNSEGIKTSNLQWLGTVNYDFNYIGSKFELSSTLFMQYGQSKIFGQDVEKLQDVFVFAITPSILLINKPAIRLFFETTAETNLGKGTIADNPTSFLDPLFLYQTLFLGQKHYSSQKETKTTWDITYGLGYAFQQTVNKNFELQPDLNGNSSDFETGFSAILELNINSQISESISFVLNAKAVALSRENFFKDFDSSRRSILVRSGLFFENIGIEYNYHQINDLNLSEMAMVDQSIMLTIRF